MAGKKIHHRQGVTTLSGLELEQCKDGENIYWQWVGQYTDFSTKSASYKDEQLKWLTDTVAEIVSRKKSTASSSGDQSKKEQ